MRFDEKDESQFAPAAQPGDTPTTDANCKPEITPKTSAQTYLDALNFALNKIFTKKMRASLTRRDSILTEALECVLTGNEERCKQNSPYIHSFLHYLHFKSGCLCIQTLGKHINQQQKKKLYQHTKSNKKHIAERFSWLISRIGKSKNHSEIEIPQNSVNSPLNKRKFPLKIQDRAKKELQIVIDQGHNKKLDSCLDINFISPIVITIRKDSYIKLALDSSVRIESFHMNEYQMPNIDNLFQLI